MATENYLPSAKKIPDSVGLSLSGGGFRATLFHLGAIRRLNEFGICPRLTTISSVSGGSILNGFPASRLPEPIAKGVADFQNAVSNPMQQFCSLDIRRWLAVEAVIPGTHNSPGLAKQYDQHLTNGKLLNDIPAAPIHTFCSTDLTFGVNWTFKREQCGDWQAGFQSTPADWPLGTAVAARRRRLGLYSLRRSASYPGNHPRSRNHAQDSGSSWNSVASAPGGGGRLPATSLRLRITTAD